MATVEHEFEQFKQFVELQLHAGANDASLDELFDLWRRENPSHQLAAEDLAAIAASVEDFAQGERGTLAGEHSAELRHKHGLRNE